MKNRNITFRIILSVLAWFAVLPQMQALSPAPDGCYPNFTTAKGCDALNFLTTGAVNTGLGWRSLFLDSTGSFNTGVGGGALALNNADSNTAVGAVALLLNTTGGDNTAVGAFALFSNVDAGRNTAVGSGTLRNNTSGELNTAVGEGALNNNIDGDGNTATGTAALNSNIDGNSNTATGFDALLLNTGGDFNTAAGFAALELNTIGHNNTANGVFALFNNDGDFNTAIGSSALSNNTSGSGNTALGALAGTAITTADNVVAIATAGANVSDSCFIGYIYSNVQPIVGVDPDSVTITSSGRLGRGNVSSRRYKHNIQPMEKASEAIYSLQPVSFRYNKEYDATQTLAFGLIAEEVAEVYPDLVGRNSKGEPESVRYDQINALLLNEFLKEHRKVEQLKNEFNTTVAHQQKEIQVLTAQLQQQAAKIQRVSAQLEVSKPAPQVAAENR